MSHLTHSKEDPLFAGSENENSLLSDSNAVKSASVARKADFTAPNADDATNGGSRPVAYRSATLGRAEDFRWLQGRLGRKLGRKGEWTIRYAAPGAPDPFGGELTIVDSPRLGLLREGDLVHVSGAVVDVGAGRKRYRVDSVSLLDQ